MNTGLAKYKEIIIAASALLAIVLHLLLLFVFRIDSELYGIAAPQWPLIVALVAGGIPLLVDLIRQMFHREFGSDLLAGMSIVTALLLGEYLAGTVVVLMLSGGKSLEAYAVRSASSVLEALVRRMPALAHRREGEALVDIALDSVSIGDELVVFPHEICPVDGTVIEGHGSMDESYLTGEPYVISKAPGSGVLSGAINGEAAMTIEATRIAADSRYAKILQVMRASEQQRPRLRRLGDQLGAFYTPLALAIAIGAWIASGQSVRFLSVLVVATPCPLLIAIPVAIIGSISLCARRGIIIKDPAVLEKIERCRTAIFDKTGTLTYGEPRLTEILTSGEGTLCREEILKLAAAVERYSKHPLSRAIIRAAEEAGHDQLQTPTQISERPGEGLRGVIDGRNIAITGRSVLMAHSPELAAKLPPVAEGMECVMLVDGGYAGTFRFRDEPRREGKLFIRHLEPSHHFDRILLVSGDREPEVRYLAEQVGIDEVYFGQTPEQKLDLVRVETAEADTVFLGDGINDAPALTAATVGIAFGQNSDITSEAAGAVVLESSLQRVDEFMHISSRMRSIALQSAVGGMALSLIGMFAAASGFLQPVAGAITQEIVDLIAVANALRAALPPKILSDY
jgi:heavy metal translocating P-type ATPase